MSPTARKRFDAFEDFPTEDSTSKITPAVQSSIPATQKAATQVERIERLKPSQMMPDRFQPRRLLPTQVRIPFFLNKVDCYQAAAQWLELARQETAYQIEIDRLLAMGDSFENHGQIKPITGSWVSATGGHFIFLIETGERRFWAACLRAVTEQQKDEPLLRVEVISQPTRQRQVLENRHAETPSAVSQSCEIASLILAEMNMQPSQATQDEFEYFRSARSQRMPAGLWEKVMPIMQLTRPRMVQLLNILQFPTPLLELADRHRLPERVLREVLALPSEQWERMLRLSIQNSLTSDDVVEISARPTITNPAPLSPPPAPPTREAASGLRRFQRSLSKLDRINLTQALDELADELVVSGDAEQLSGLLSELNSLLFARLSRR